MRYVNFFFFLFLLVIYLSFSSQIKFSTNFLEVFFSKQSVELFNRAKKLGFADEILVAKKGFEQKELDELYNLAEELKKIPQITKVEIKNTPSSELKNYMKRNYLLFSDFDTKVLSENEIEKRLTKIYDSIYNAFSFTPINSYDPLELFSMSEVKIQRYTKLKDFGYVLRAKTSIDTADATQARELYDELNKVIKKHSDVIAIASFFYLVENSAYIKNDAQIIMFISSVMLLGLYFFMLKNNKLFFNTILAIGSSVLAAILVSWLLFDSISILALVFGISITTISIDYMFHYYFHQNFSLKKPIFQKRVFLGFLTTFGVFVIFSFIDIELFAQLAIFSAISLSVAYLLFSLVFVYLDIAPPKKEQEVGENAELKPLYLVIVSFLMLGYVYINLEFDTELKNLDYQNDKLSKLTKKFNEGLDKNSYQTVLINGESKENLLQNYEILLLQYPLMVGIGKFVLSDKKCQKRLEELQRYDFKKIQNTLNKYEKKVGFREGTFKNAYKGIDKQSCNFKVLEDMKFKIIKDVGKYYTVAFLDKNEVIQGSPHVEVINLAKSLREDTKHMKKTLSSYMMVSLVFILLILFVVSGKKMLHPLVYLLLPISTALFAITIFGKINIMHIFALVILFAISIDYGIYMYKTKTINETKKAISYALLSTFSGFGVLVFSDTVALYSIGFVICVGICSIFFLIYANTLFSKINYK